MKQRLQKILAAAGLCSRRNAEKWLTEGRIYVNGERALLGQSADPERDAILVDGKPLPPLKTRCYIMLNKPRGFVCTCSDERGRPTVADLVRDCGARVFPVGRLDYDSEGLLLMTDDGEWAHRIMHPAFAVNKTYQVKVRGNLEHAAEKLASLREVEGEPISPAGVRLLSKDAGSALLEITIHEGKNRQIRRMCISVGLHVAFLRRVSEHGLTLGSLPVGKWRYLRANEIRYFEKD